MTRKEMGKENRGVIRKPNKWDFLIGDYLNKLNGFSTEMLKGRVYSCKSLRIKIQREKKPWAERRLIGFYTYVNLDINDIDIQGNSK